MGISDEVMGASDLADAPAQSSKRSYSSPDPMRIDLRLIIGVLGASFCMAWHMVLLVRPEFLAPGYQDANGLSLLCGFSVALLLAYFILSFMVGPFQEHRQAMGIAALACGACAFFPLGGDSFVLMVARLACAGAGVALALTLWIEFLCMEFGRVIRKSFAMALTLGLLWSFCLLLVDGAYAQSVIFAYSLASSVAYLVLCRSLTRESAFPSYDATETDERNLITWRPVLLTVVGSMAQGFSLSWILPPEPVPSWIALVAIGSALVLSACLLYDTMHRFVIKESLIRRLFLPIIASSILALLFTPQEWRPLPALITFAFSFLPYASALFATCEHIVRCQLSTARAFSTARPYAVVGLFCGLLFGGFATSSDMFGELTMQVWVVVVVLIFVVVFSLVTSKSFYPGDDEADGVGTFLGAEACEGAPAPFADVERAFRERCREVAHRFGLTERQEEVLYLLAKGRNTAYIQEELVISPHTVKAHTYAIYKKLDLHSQQELIDLVEAAGRMAGEDAGKDALGAKERGAEKGAGKGAVRHS